MGVRCGFESLWEKWLFSNYPELETKFKHYPSGMGWCEEFYGGKDFKTRPMTF